MKTFNIKYENINKLKQFINSNSIEKYDNILLQIFTGVCDEEFIYELVENIKTLIPHIKIIGTTTSGEILEGDVYRDSTILSFSIFEKTLVKTFYTKFYDDSYVMGEELVTQFKEYRPKVAITFTDGLSTNGEEYLKSFNEFDKNLIVAGGLAGDNNNFKKTIVFTEENITNNGAVVAILINDNLIAHTKVSFGWESIGKTMVVTKAEKNIVYEIDGVKVQDIYKKYLGEEVAKLLPKTGIEFPLIVKRGPLKLTRAVIGKGEDGSLLFAGNLEEGDEVTFGYGNVDAILQYSEKIAKSDVFNTTESIFIYSCMARLLLMQGCIAKEIRVLSRLATVSGFFTYGEFFTDEDSKNNEMLNQSMTILALSESNIEKQRVKKQIEHIDSKDSLTLRALSTLISQTSKELEETNRELKKQVELKAKENLNKKILLKKQSKMAQMGQMLSIIAHQWRQPLSAISSTLLSLQVKLNNNRFNFDNKSDREEFLKLLKQKHNDIFFYLESLSETIDDFRNFFKANKTKDKVSIVEPIEQALSIIKTSIVNRGIKLNISYETKDEIRIYKNEMMQVILNILKNAKDNFIEKDIQNPIIYIKTKKEKGNYIIQICDNGGGIDNKILPHIFDLYYSTKDNKNGTGLGLYISKIIVEEHNGGKLSAKNIDDGVCFTISLPKK